MSLLFSIFKTKTYFGNSRHFIAPNKTNYQIISQHFGNHSLCEKTFTKNKLKIKIFSCLTCEKSNKNLMYSGFAVVLIINQPLSSGHRKKYLPKRRLLSENDTSHIAFSFKLIKKLLTKKRRTLEDCFEQTKHHSSTSTSAPIKSCLYSSKH